jgi:hypothetical protein
MYHFRYVSKNEIAPLKNQGQFLLTQYIRFASKMGTLKNKKKRGNWNGINNLSQLRKS